MLPVRKFVAMSENDCRASTTYSVPKGQAGKLGFFSTCFYGLLFTHHIY